jgi:RNA polymerase sigma-70 factor (ECF subfamily)
VNNDRLAQPFEDNRGRLRAVAYRMLGSLSEADDAVQETWRRFARSDTDSTQNSGGRLTALIARVCMDMLRLRKLWRDESSGVHLPDPVVSRADAVESEQQLLLADSVGLALLVVLETLAPAERLAFVLHDMFALSFEDIAPIVGRAPTAVRQLANRARRRVQATPHLPDVDLPRQRTVVNAFLAAARAGDSTVLLSMLDPDVVVRSDGGPTLAATSMEVRGAPAVAGQAVTFAQLATLVQPVVVNGAAGAVSWLPSGRLFSLMAFTVRLGKIVEIDVLNDPERLRQLKLESFALTDPQWPSSV